MLKVFKILIIIESLFSLVLMIMLFNNKFVLLYTNIRYVVFLG